MNSYWYFCDYPSFKLKQEVIDWATELFGQPEDTVYGRWCAYYDHLRFKQHSDYILYILRWL